MAEQQITNPLAAHQDVTSFITGRTSQGELLSWGQEVREFRADAAIAKGEVVAWVAPTATVPLSVTPMTVAAADILFAGVAQEAAAVGAPCTIVTEGFALVDVGAETAAFGSLLTCPGTTTGKAEIGAVIDATTIVYSIMAIGVALGVKDSANLAPAIIKHV